MTREPALIDERGAVMSNKPSYLGLLNAIAIATSGRSDLEKMKALKLHRLDTRDEPDIFDGFFADHSIDIRTGELLGRYIAEERDSARLLRSCYEQLKRAADERGDGAVDD